MAATGETLLVWHVIATAGFDSAWMRLDERGFSARGHAVGQRREPYSLTYVVETDAQLVTSRVSITCEREADVRTLDLRRDAHGWTVDGQPRPDLDDALDCDIECCPVTNTMPIVRHDLHRQARTRNFVMAFIRVPTLDVVASRQTYEHINLIDAVAVVRYSSGSFTSDLVIDERGFVVDYPQLGSRLVAG
jgi:hypothetical protein